jgi:hypothetical protein
VRHRIWHDFAGPARRFCVWQRLLGKWFR